MNTLFDSMLKQYRHKKQTIHSQVASKFSSQDINDVFRPSNTKLEENKIIVENEEQNHHTLFKPSKISQ